MKKPDPNARFDYEVPPVLMEASFPIGWYIKRIKAADGMDDLVDRTRSAFFVYTDDGHYPRIMSAFERRGKELMLRMIEETMAELNDQESL